MGFQKCPVCSGTGLTDNMTGLSAGPIQCPTCKGHRIISEITGLPPAYDQKKEKFDDGILGPGSRIHVDMDAFGITKPINMGPMMKACPKCENLRNSVFGLPLTDCSNCSGSGMIKLFNEEKAAPEVAKGTEIKECEYCTNAFNRKHSMPPHECPKCLGTGWRAVKTTEEPTSSLLEKLKNAGSTIWRTDVQPTGAPGVFNVKEGEMPRHKDLKKDIQNLRNALTTITSDFGKPGNFQKARVWEAFIKIEDNVRKDWKLVGRNDVLPSGKLNADTSPQEVKTGEGPKYVDIKLKKIDKFNWRASCEHLALNIYKPTKISSINAINSVLMTKGLAIAHIVELPPNK